METPDSDPVKSTPTVARTMAEAGKLCPDCEHPFGRHIRRKGGSSCQTLIPSSADGRCGCSALPVGRR